MKLHSLLCRGLVLLLAFCNTAAFPEQTPAYDEDEIKPDTALTLPPMPQKANLVHYPTDWPGNEVFIDTSSLVFGANNTISYTMVVRGSQGAENITFESMRCAGVRRVVAYGRRDGTWSPARSEEWLPITDANINRQYFEFWRDVFCRNRALMTKREVLENIKNGGHQADYSPPTGQ